MRLRIGCVVVGKIHPVHYRYKADNAMGIRDTDEHVGVVAQDVQTVIPEAVTQNSKGYLLLNSDPIIWSMLNAIKEQQGEVQHEQAELAKALRLIKQHRVCFGRRVPPCGVYRLKSARLARTYGK